MRIRAIAAAVLLPVALSAQQPSTAVVQTFTGFGRPYGAWLIAAFDSIPAAKYDFKPTPVQQSVGHIAQHLEHANYELCERFSRLKHPLTAKDSLADTVKAQWPKDTLIARVRSSLLFCRDALATLNDASLADEMKAGPPGAEVTVVRARWLLLLVTDLAEHYSQISGYMRLLGMVPPSAR